MEPLSSVSAEDHREDPESGENCGVDASPFSQLQVETTNRGARSSVQEFGGVALSLGENIVDCLDGQRRSEIRDSNMECFERNEEESQNNVESSSSTLAGSDENGDQPLKDDEEVVLEEREELDVHRIEREQGRNEDVEQESRTEKGEPREIERPGAQVRDGAERCRADVQVGDQDQEEAMTQEAKQVDGQSEGARSQGQPQNISEATPGSCQPVEEEPGGDQDSSTKQPEDAPEGGYEAHEALGEVHTGCGETTGEGSQQCEGNEGSSSEQSKLHHAQPGEDVVWQSWRFSNDGNETPELADPSQPDLQGEFAKAVVRSSDQGTSKKNRRQSTPRKPRVPPLTDTIPKATRFGQQRLLERAAVATPKKTVNRGEQTEWQQEEVVPAQDEGRGAELLAEGWQWREHGVPLGDVEAKLREASTAVVGTGKELEGAVEELITWKDTAAARANLPTNSLAQLTVISSALMRTSAVTEGQVAHLQRVCSAFSPSTLFDELEAMRVLQMRTDREIEQWTQIVEKTNREAKRKQRESAIVMRWYRLVSGAQARQARVVHRQSIRKMQDKLAEMTRKVKNIKYLCNWEKKRADRAFMALHANRKLARAALDVVDGDPRLPGALGTAPGIDGMPSAYELQAFDLLMKQGNLNSPMMKSPRMQPASVRGSLLVPGGPEAVLEGSLREGTGSRGRGGEPGGQAGHVQSLVPSRPTPATSTSSNQGASSGDAVQAVGGGGRASVSTSRNIADSSGSGANGSRGGTASGAATGGMRLMTGGGSGWGGGGPKSPGIDPAPDSVQRVGIGLAVGNGAPLFLPLAKMGESIGLLTHPEARGPALTERSAADQRLARALGIENMEASQVGVQLQRPAEPTNGTGLRDLYTRREVLAFRVEHSKQLQHLQACFEERIKMLHEFYEKILGDVQPSSMATSGGQATSTSGARPAPNAPKVKTASDKPLRPDNKWSPRKRPTLSVPQMMSARMAATVEPIAIQEEESLNNPAPVVPTEWTHSRDDEVSGSDEARRRVAGPLVAMREGNVAWDDRVDRQGLDRPAARATPLAELAAPRNRTPRKHMTAIEKALYVPVLPNGSLSLPAIRQVQNA